MNDELAKWLRDCGNDSVGCGGCPYKSRRRDGSCINGLLAEAADAIEKLSKERIEGTCQTCARSSDMCGGNITQCPIEEHYALPLDGYCHLYEPPEEERV